MPPLLPRPDMALRLLQQQSLMGWGLALGQRGLVRRQRE